ncbi:MAG: TlpA disulfide reductase family protein [Nocardioides sp.]
MRRALLPLLLVPLLAACGSHGPAAITGGTSHVDVATKDLVAYKKKTDVPDCPRVAAKSAPGGMPSVTLPCLGGGRSVDVAGLRGPMIVNLWASWCEICRKEMPALASYARGQSQVKVLGIDYSDPNPAGGLELARSSKVGYPLVADPEVQLDHASPLPHFSGLPYTVYIDASGKVVNIEAGALRTEADVAAAAKQYLGVGG